MRFLKRLRQRVFGLTVADEDEYLSVLCSQAGHDCDVVYEATKLSADGDGDTNFSEVQENIDMIMEAIPVANKLRGSYGRIEDLARRMETHGLDEKTPEEMLAYLSNCKLVDRYEQGFSVRDHYPHMYGY
ncbi:hypothetical protein GOV10_01180 [Candidatus Woesearchaeota archaeon]|nr:hypothetical protein [Candidatus Woesearchaeota archaeon]